MTTVAAALCAVSALVPAAEPPRVVVSIAPLHSIVAGVMSGVGTPELMVRGYGSPHSYQLRPSDAVKLTDADIVFWIGEALESFLAKPIAALARRARIVGLIRTDGLILLPSRSGGVWETPADVSHAQDHRKPGVHAHGYGELDPHIWLDAGNAKLIVREIVRQLVSVDPANATSYEANGKTLQRRIDEMDGQFMRRLAPVRQVPYVVFHDAYQYLEQRYGLNVMGSVAAAPDRMPSARRLQALRREIRQRGARCVFREPQFTSALVETILEDTSARAGVLDPLGTQFTPGPQAYFEMMNTNVTQLVDCLSS